MKNPPCCLGLLAWFRARQKERKEANHTPDCCCGPCARSAPALGALTGQDARALAAFVHMLELYAVADRNGRMCAIHGMAAAADAMQPSTQRIAQAAIPFVLDWSDEESLWITIFSQTRRLAATELARR